MDMLSILKINKLFEPEEVITKIINTGTFCEPFLVP